jgi:AcrR family transcriptional regulator
MRNQRVRIKGRPRDEEARRAILHATYVLVLERGYEAVTTAEIAQRAGSGKQTIYRWWPSKGALVLDAFGDWVEQSRSRVRPRSLSSVLVELCRGASQTAPVLRSLMAEAQFDPVLRHRFIAQVIEPRGSELRACLSDSRAAERELIVSVVSALVWQRLLLGEPLDARFVRRVLRLVRRLGVKPGT